MNLPLATAVVQPVAVSGAPPSTAADPVDEGVSEEEIETVFSNYHCRSLDFGTPHPGYVTESAILGGISLPPASYPLTEALPASIVNSGQLSSLQLEGVLYACQRHLKWLGDGSRAGFFIGDGAGVGKGRQIAGIMLDNMCRGRRRHVWFSTSRDLALDAERDLRGLGCYARVISGCQELDRHTKAFGLAKEYRNGVLFCTYSTLVSSSRGRIGKRAVSRFDQIVSWCGGKDFDGCIVFDESHKARNFQPGNEKDSTKVGLAAIRIQRAMPRARVVYCSATGLSDVRHMAFMERLGIWGVGTSFRTFGDFKNTLEGRGLGGFEMLAMEMKVSGMYVARSLSFQPCEFRQIEVPLDQRQISTYDEAARFWIRLHDDVRDALKRTNNEGGGGMVMRTFWSAHQAFFRQLVVALKVPALVDDIRKELSTGNSCAIVGLQTTGEAALTQYLESGGMGATKGSAMPPGHSGFLSLCKQMLLGFIRRHFPVRNKPQKSQEEDKTDYVSLIGSLDASKASHLFRLNHLGQQANIYSAGIAANRVREPALAVVYQQHLTNLLVHIKVAEDGLAVLEERIQTCRALAAEQQRKLGEKLDEAKQDGQSEIKDNTHCLAMRKRLLREADALQLPTSALDALIDALGGPDRVAEMTGRRARLIRRGDRVALEPRVAPGAGSGAQEKLNIAERRYFVDGSKHIAVISDAASTGISLHAARGSANSKLRRVHYTLELPWSAEKAVQQLGRSNRSDQETGPSYRLLHINLGGEKRFAAAVAKRLQALGALTKGDRRAADGSSLKEGNLDSKYGNTALRGMLEFVRDRALRPVSGSDSPPPLEAAPGTAAWLVHPPHVPAGVNREVLAKVGLDPLEKNKTSVSTFLNRILGLPVAEQNVCFAHFFERLEWVVARARAQGKFNDGAATVAAGSRVSLESEEVLFRPSPHASTPSADGAQDRVVTKLTTLLVDRRVSLEDARSLLDAEEDADVGDGKGQESKDDDEDTAHNSSMGGAVGLETKASQNIKDNVPGFYVSKQKIVGRYRVLLALRNAIDPDQITVYRPKTGRSRRIMQKADLRRLYRRVENGDEKAKFEELWRRAYDDSDPSQLCILNGPVLLTKLWPKLTLLFNQYALAMTMSERLMRVVTVQITNGPKIVGIRVPLAVIGSLKEHIKAIEQERKVNGSAQVKIDKQDTTPSPVIPKARDRALRKAVTMMSFFGDHKPGVHPSDPVDRSPMRKRKKTQIQSPKRSPKKQKSLLSFFAKRR